MKEGWEVKKLGDICEIKPPKKLAKEKLSESDLVTFFPMEDLKIFNHYIKPIKTKYLKDVYGGYVYFENNDVLLAKITPCFENGKLGIAKDLKNGIGFGSSEYMVFRPKVGVLSEYIYYFLSLENIRRVGKNRMTGAVGHKRIPVDYLSNQNLITPPLPEQKRIVAILDKTFSAIAKAKANAEQNLKNAKELFESYLQEVFEKVKAKGQLFKLANYLDLITYGFTNPMPTTDSGPFKVTAKNVKNGIVDYETSRRTSQEAFDNLITDKCRPKKGDVLLTKDGTLGRLAVVEHANLCINQSVALLRPDKQLDSYYLKALLSSQFYQSIMISQAGGATIKHIYITRVDKMDVPVPSLKEQQTIVQKLEAFNAETKKLETIYQQKIQDLEELKKSVLQKAFNGELTDKEIPG